VETQASGQSAVRRQNNVTPFEVVDELLGRAPWSAGHAPRIGASTL